MLEFLNSGLYSLATPVIELFSILSHSPNTFTTFQSPFASKCQVRDHACVVLSPMSTLVCIFRSSCLGLRLTPFAGAPAMAAICHCTDCQKWAGSGNSTNVVVTKDAFKITKGEPKSYNMKGGSGQDYPHFFCGGAYLFTTHFPQPCLILCYRLRIFNLWTARVYGGVRSDPCWHS